LAQARVAALMEIATGNKEDRGRMELAEVFETENK
jgi:hypothetical protein